MLRAHKIALDPNLAQRRYFARASGVARFAYNWALAEWQAQYRAGGKPSEVSLRRQLNALKREQFPWMFDVTKCAVQEAIIDLGTAFRGFFEKRGKYPRFKKKTDRAAFCAANEAGTFRADGKRIKLPVVGWVRMREAVRFEGSLKRAMVSRDADRWFVSCWSKPMPPQKRNCRSPRLALISALRRWRSSRPANRSKVRKRIRHCSPGCVG